MALLENLNKPLLRVRHSELARATSESLFRSECPACEGGLLLVHRDQGKLVRFDHCISCAQRVEYLDRDIAGEILYPIQN
jgi:hypothetical protein